MGWFFPLPFLVSRVIEQLLESSAQGTLVVRPLLTIAEVVAMISATTV